MERSYKQLLAALLLGLMMPLGLLRPAADTAQPIPPSTQPQLQQPTDPTETPEQPELPRYILVQAPQAEVVEMALEEYILGVVLAEMPASFSPEALKAQAVVARTYALRRQLLGDRHETAVICMDPGCCQAYIAPEAYLQSMGTQEDLDRIWQAVKQTEDQVLTYLGQPAEATYFSCSGGRTEDAQAVWGQWIPYLQAVDSPGESAATVENTVYFTAEAFCAALGRQLTGKPSQWLGQTARTDGGGVAYMFIGGISYTGTDLRRLLGLNSTAFEMTADAMGIFVTTRGKGHRVGMSQYGADAMAVAGSKFEQILTHYYPGTRIDKIDALG